MIPAPAPGINIIYMHITIASRISTGIRYLLTFSIPFSTPKTTISAVSPKKIKKNTSGAYSCPIKFAKNKPSAAAMS